MNDLDRKFDKFGNVIVDSHGVMDALLCGMSIKDVTMIPDDDVEEYNFIYKNIYLDYELEDATPNLYSPSSITVADFDKENQNKWNIPDEYKEIDLYEYLGSKISTTEEAQRLAHELEIFDNRNMFGLLKTMIYLIDLMKKNNIIYGVGRGSSVASFTLYLIGVHRINPIEYDIDFGEFLD